MCGRVVRYQFGSTDAVDTGFGSNHNNLNADYVDGVSITRGSPHQHVWTLMAAHSESINHTRPFLLCPCNNGSTIEVQSFIGNNYFCEAANISTMLHVFCTHLIHFGMVKIVALLKNCAAQYLVFHGFIETMATLPLLTI